KIVAEYQSKKDVVFVGIDRSHLNLSNEDRDQEERLKKLKNYIESRKVTHKVVLDEWIPRTDKRPEHYRIANDYSVSGNSQFYVIDKDGIVKYKNSAIHADLDYFYRELKAALKLI